MTYYVVIVLFNCKMNEILFITGLNGSINNGLGYFIKENYNIKNYFELKDEFNTLTHSEQLGILNGWLKQNINGVGYIIAVSYGAYLFLNNLEKITLEKETVLILITPVLGMAKTTNGGRFPAGSSYFSKLVKNKKLQMNNESYLITGSEDLISPKDAATKFCNYYPNTELIIFEGNDHNLSKSHLKKVISEIIN